MVYRADGTSSQHDFSSVDVKGVGGGDDTVHFQNDEDEMDETEQAVVAGNSYAQLLHVASIQHFRDRLQAEIQDKRTSLAFSLKASPAAIQSLMQVFCNFANSP